MSFVNNVNEVLHRIRVKLYPSYFPKTEGRYIARTDSEASLGIEEVCAALINRGGFIGRYEDLIENVKQFLDEVAYELCDGFTINFKYFSIYPNVGGTFKSERDSFDPVKNRVSFRYRTLGPLRRLINHIAVDITGLYDNKAYIGEFIDRDEDSSNGIFQPGSMFCIKGNKIMLEGDDPACGVFFVPVDDPASEVKVDRIGENSAQKVTGIAPETGHPVNRIEIRTQYSGTKVPLKKPRTIVSKFTIEAA